MVLVLLTGLVLGCASEEPFGPIKGRVICRGGCLNTAYLVEIDPEFRMGQPQTVMDTRGITRGSFQNIVIINNLKADDQHENVRIRFRNFSDVKFSCQSSYPRAMREIEIAY